MLHHRVMNDNLLLKSVSRTTSTTTTTYGDHAVQKTAWDGSRQVGHTWLSLLLKCHIDSQLCRSGTFDGQAVDERARSVSLRCQTRIFDCCRDRWKWPHRSNNIINHSMSPLHHHHHPGLSFSFTWKYFWDGMVSNYKISSLSMPHRTRG